MYIWIGATRYFLDNAVATKALMATNHSEELKKKVVFVLYIVFLVFVLSSVTLCCYLGLRGSCGGLFVNGCNVFTWGIQFISPLGILTLTPFLLQIDPWCQELE